MIPTLALLAILSIILIWANAQPSTVTRPQKKIIFKGDHMAHLRKLNEKEKTFIRRCRNKVTQAINILYLFIA